MILEGLVTTTDSAGAMHLAPMGPHVDTAMREFLLRPFPTSQTYQNLRVRPEGVLHVTDDALLLAKAAIGKAGVPPYSPATVVRGFILTDACRAYEFRVRSVDESEQRVRLACEVVHVVRQRDFLGFNRARHAVVEAAILATRVHLLPRDEILAKYRELAVIVRKTGDAPESQAMDMLWKYVDSAHMQPSGSESAGGPA